MLIRHIQVSSYRNLERQTVEFADGINLFVGDNGHGKTNILEAVHLLATLRSFRNASTSDLIRHGEKDAQVNGLVVSENVPVQLKLVMNKGGRRLWIGGNAVRGIKDYLGRLRVVAFTPDDLAMVKGGPSVRRSFLDRAVFLFRPDHLRVVKEFNTSLKARNRLLKSMQPVDRDVLDSFSQKMAEYGAKVTEVRREILNKISGFATSILTEVGGGKELLGLDFKPGWQTEGAGTADALLQQLNSHLEQDLRRKQTSLGPQQDDFEVLHASMPARKFASQGQQRSCALALLLSVVQAVISEGDERPVILLDDVSSELDAVRRDKLFYQILQIGSQVLVTTTDENLVSGLSENISKRYRVANGKIVTEPH